MFPPFFLVDLICLRATLALLVVEIGTTDIAAGAMDSPCSQQQDTDYEWIGGLTDTGSYAHEIHQR
ncbi:hypothetical protein D3C81_2128210 [compost metagenome]